MTGLVAVMNIDRPVGIIGAIICALVLLAGVLYVGLVTGGGYHGRLPWDARNDDPQNYPCPKCGARRGEPCSDE